LDRTGDGKIDIEEFEYVLSEFGIKEKDSRQSFQIFTQYSSLPIDFDRFVALFEEYYLSDNPSDLGNFVNGILEFKVDNPKVDENAPIPDLILEYEMLKEDDLMDQTSLQEKEKKDKAKEGTRGSKIYGRIKKIVKLKCFESKG